MNSLLLHSGTQQDIDSFLRKPSHALLIEGPLGSGKAYLATSLAKQLIGAKEVDNRNIIVVRPDPSISIETIRDVQTQLKLKVPGQQTVNRVVIIEDAHTMTIEAQNAFLKLLEEPPAGTVIVLTVTQHTALLPTISSRTQRMTTKLPSRSQVAAYFAAKHFTTHDITRAYHLSNGRMGLMTALLNESEDHPLVHEIAVAKQLLQAPAFERLIMLEPYANNREKLQLLIEALVCIAEAALHAASNGNKLAQAKRWHKTTDFLYNLEEDLVKLPSSKLVLTHLALNL